MNAERISRLSKKELKAPDAFQAAGAQAQGWLMTNQRMLLWGAGLAIAAVLVVGIFQWVASRGENRAAHTLGDALRPLERPVDNETFKTQAEKDQATEKSLSAVVASEGKTRAGITALFPLAQAELRLGKTDPALEHFNSFLSSAPSEDPLRTAAMEGRGYAFEAKGQLDQALAAFDQEAKEGSAEFLPGMGDFHRGRILTALGKKEEAASVFSSIPVVHPGTAAARMAEERLSALAAAGVVVPAAASTKDAGI